MAASAVNDEASPPPPSTKVTRSYVVRTGSVDRSQRFAAEAEWPPTVSVRQARTGVVTSVGVEPGRRVEPGDPLFTVDLRPVVIAEGAIPSFRPLSVGVSGPDVLQVDAFLRSIGKRHGARREDFLPDLSRDVTVWQRAIGVPPTGLIETGDILFVPKLPARVVLADDIAVGATVTSGGLALHVLPDAPTFRIVLTSEQRSLVPLQANVVVHPEGATWTGRITAAMESAAGALELRLGTQDGGPLCGSDCERVPVAGKSNFPVDVIVVPRTSGPVVPVSAIGTDVRSSPYVLDQSGRRRPVRIVASDGGLAVVDGIEPGTRVRLFARNDPLPPSSRS